MSRRQLRVLVVEDEAMLRALWTGLLTGAAFDVVGEAPDGATALDLTSALCPDAMVVESHLPDFSGVEVIRRVRQELPRLIAVVVTSNPDVTNEVEATAAAFLKKGEGVGCLPLTLLELAERHYPGQFGAG